MGAHPHLQNCTSRFEAAFRGVGCAPRHAAVAMQLIGGCPSGSRAQAGRGRSIGTALLLLAALSSAWARSAAEDVSKDVVVVPGTLPAAGNATALPHSESAAAPPPAVPATAAVCPLAACSPAVLQIAHSTFEIPWENDCTLPLRLLQMAAAAAARCS